MRSTASRAPGIILVTWGLFECLQIAAPQVASAEDPNQAAKSAPQGTQQDDAATEKAQRDAAGLLTIEGTVVDESGSPVPNARVQLHASRGGPFKTLSDLQGRFRFRFVDVPTARYLAFVADNRRDGRKGYLEIVDHGAIGVPGPMQIVLKAPRELVVAVNDRNGNPVAGALVGIEDLLQEGLTGPDGTLQLKLPADAKINQVVALKSGTGFDYWTSLIDRNADPRPLPPKIELTFNGARTVRVQAVDSDGQPVHGIRVVPWTVAKQGQTHYVNLSGFRSELENVRTNSNGIAMIDWLPVDLSQGVTFLARSSDFHLPQPPSLWPGPQNDVVELTMQLLRVTRISGTVYHNDGKPAAGIVLQAEGRGATNHYFRGFARTNADGGFDFKAYPDQAYLISVLDENWAAPSCTVAEVHEGEPVGGLEFRLIRGTVLRGVAAIADGHVQADATVTLIASAKLAGVEATPQLVRWARIDSQGRYHFRIGPGTYELLDPDHKKSIPLTIDSQQEVVHDFRADQ